MKKLSLNMLPVSSLAVVGFAQNINAKSNTAQPTTKSKTLTTPNNSASTSATIAQNTSMTKPKHRHPTIHTSKQKTTK
jgi:hypothetical protein